MKYLSVCSGIEAASVAWAPLGFEPVAFSEIEAFPSAVLAHHYPGVPNWGDMTKYEAWPDANIDVLVGGTPCQSFSVAGFRKGLADPRGNLALTYLAIADRYRPRWVVWENVPGVLSAVSHAAPDPCPPPPPVDLGRDGATVETDDEYESEELHAFACFVAGLSELGYGVAYGTLDAQYAGLAQRRERVFVVGYLGDWRRCSAVLLERGSLSGDPSPRREAGENVAGTLGGSSQSGGFRTTDLDNSGAFIPEIVPQAMSAKWSKGTSGPAGDEVANLIAFDTTQITHPENRSNPQPDGPSPQLAAAAHAPTIAFSVKDHGGDATVELSPTLRSGNEVTANASGGVMPAIAFEPRVASGRREGKIGDTVGSLTKESDRGDGFPCVAFQIGSRADQQHGSGIGEPGEPVGTIGTRQEHGIAYALGSHAGAADGDQTNRSHASGGPVGLNVSEELAYSLREGRGQSVASFQESQSGARVGDTHPTLDAHNGSRRHQGIVGFADVADPVAANQARTYTREGSGNFRMSNVAHNAVQVRRLTPRECERLQGFPDDYTLIPYRRKPAADGPRYKALGNSMAVPVMAWIGRRMVIVDEIEASE